MEQTTRGERDREREKEVMEGEPIDAHEGGGATRAANTTRDKGVEPAADRSRGDKKS